MTQLRSIGGLKPIYFVPREDIASEVLIPCLGNAVSVDCMVGFFSGRSLAMLAPGLASFIAESSSPLRLVICPVLRAEDREAISAGCNTPETVIHEFLASGLTVEDALTRHTLRCLAYLIGVGRVEIRVALLEDAIFHPKVWLISQGEDTVAVHGSSNLTVSGLSKNFEQVSVTRSWTDETSKSVVVALRAEFDAIWSHRSPECTVFEFPEAVSRKILREYAGMRAPAEEEFLTLLNEGQASDAATDRGPAFRIPLHLNYRTGEFAHQGAAVEAIEASGFRGVAAMATGSGKTITAMLAAHRLYMREHRLLIVISAPYLPLISQWCNEVSEFGLEPLNLGLVAGADARSAEVARVGRRIRMSHEDVAEALVITHKTLCDKGFQNALSRVDVPVLLIADEVHNLGAEGFISSPPQSIPFRIGLSATPQRQYDPEGTDALFAYFGPTVFTFSLEEAIGVCLVPYEYFVQPVNLTDDEVDAWMQLTERIIKVLRKNDGQLADDNPILQMLLQRRRLVLESAEAKLEALSRLLDEQDRESLSYTLIYATDKDPEQLNRVNDLLRQKRIRFHQLTAEETSSRDLTRRVVEAFERRDLQVLTAKRVLDEGVNIPQISKAYVLASTTVERQWVQRRGRLLRKCNAIGKQFSIIYDFLVVPPRASVDSDTKNIVKAELRRIREFARLSSNFGAATGALPIIDPVIRDFFLDPEDVYATG